MRTETIYGANAVAVIRVRFDTDVEVRDAIGAGRQHGLFDRLEVTLKIIASLDLIAGDVRTMRDTPRETHCAHPDRFGGEVRRRVDRISSRILAALARTDKRREGDRTSRAPPPFNAHSSRRPKGSTPAPRRLSTPVSSGASG